MPVSSSGRQPPKALGRRSDRSRAGGAALSPASLQGEGCDHTHFPDEESAWGLHVPVTWPRSQGGEPLFFLKRPGSGSTSRCCQEAPSPAPTGRVSTLPGGVSAAPGTSRAWPGSRPHSVPASQPDGQACRVHAAWDPDVWANGGETRPVWVCGVTAPRPRGASPRPRRPAPVQKPLRFPKWNF